MTRSSLLRRAGVLGAAALLGAASAAAGQQVARPAARPADAGRAATRAASFLSPSLGVRKELVVYLPPSYEADRGRRYPVLYYLHGMWGGEWDWARQGGVAAAMDSLARGGAPEAIVVMPDGDDGWYTTWNSLPSRADCPSRAPAGEPAERYCVPWTRYDDYVARDLVAWVDSTYRTLASRERRALGGLSMGGYGAVTLALRYPDVFRAAASHSGALAPVAAGPVARAVPPARPTVAELERGWGPRFWPYLRPVFGRDTMGWWARDPARIARRLRDSLPARTPALFADVGSGDPFLAQNRAFRDSLARLGAPLAYAEHPGAHDWAYWRGHVGESLAWLLAEVSR